MKLHGGCTQHTPTRFQPKITKNKQEITKKCIFFLTNSKKERDQTLVHQELTIQEKIKNPPRGVRHLASSNHQDITPNIIFIRERYQNSQVGRKF